MKKHTIKKRVIKEENVDSWVYILLLTSIAILGWVLSGFKFYIGKASVTVAMFAYPFRYFMANMITKKYGYKVAMNGIMYSAILLFIFMLISNMLGYQDVNIVPIVGELLGYVVSQIINITIYYYLLLYTEKNRLALLAMYIFVMLVDNLFGILFFSRMIIISSFWRTYFVTILIESIVSIILINCDEIQ